MNMLDRPDLLQRIEVLDGEHLMDGSLAQFCFRVLSATDGAGYAWSVEGEVFVDSIVVHGGIDAPRTDRFPAGYEDDTTSRRIVAANLFGYTEDVKNEDMSDPSVQVLPGAYLW